MDDNLKVEWIIKMYNDVKLSTVTYILNLATDLHPHSSLFLGLATHYQ